MFSLAKLVTTGGFSPGRTFGPVVATVGVGLEAGLVDGGTLDTDDPAGSVEDGPAVNPPEPLLVHATAPVRTRAIGAIPRHRTP